jgi:hypothetical protein
MPMFAHGHEAYESMLCRRTRQPVYPLNCLGDCLAGVMEPLSEDED